jgi:poly(beta-D-mannuronate) lyase
MSIGSSTVKRDPFESTVRYNLFEKCEGDTECITNKSSHNTYYRNTFRDNKGSLTLRRGSDNIVDSNVFVGSSNGIEFGFRGKVKKS